MQNVIELHDEKMVDEALVRGDIDEAKRLAFAHAPVEQVPPPDAPRSWKPKKISIPHLRSRAKVYLAIGELESAASDGLSGGPAAPERASPRLSGTRGTPVASRKIVRA